MGFLGFPSQKGHWVFEYVDPSCESHFLRFSSLGKACMYICGQFGQWHGTGYHQSSIQIGGVEIWSAAFPSQRRNYNSSLGHLWEEKKEKAPLG